MWALVVVGLALGASNEQPVVGETPQTTVEASTEGADASEGEPSNQPRCR